MNEENLDLSLLNGTNVPFLEQMYDRFLADPNSVEPTWQRWFQRLGDGVSATSGGADDRGPSWARSDWPLFENPYDDTPVAEAEDDAASEAPASAMPDAASVRAATLDSIRALMMIRAYRVRGHLHGRLDPLGLEDRPEHPELAPSNYGFTDADLDKPIFIDNVLGLETATLREIIAILDRTYCSTIGVEFMHISEPEEKGWIQERIEGREKEITFTDMGKNAILQKTIEAEAFEQFLNTKYTGTKRFGLDGAEAIVPALEAIIKRGGALGLKELVIGMPHRGRLNVLANVMQKPMQAIFNEFEGGASHPEEVGGSGDVKYHLGTSADREFDGNNVHLSLTANPSHLEAVDPVALGKVRAKQDQLNDTDRTQVMGLLLHGDAAFAGQGIVAECFGLSQLKGYRTGGTVHVIVNNQIGFTTKPVYARSSPYPSDSAKMVQAPIFHVNGDDPEAVVHVCKIATEFRQRFKKDVVIDMFCYRRFGHNEGDEPMFTQPVMYRKIKSHEPVSKQYSTQLAEEGIVTFDEAEQMRHDFRDYLEREFQAAADWRHSDADWLGGRWQGMRRARGTVRRGHTEETERTLRRLIKVVTEVPEGFEVHRTLKRLLTRKAKILESGRNIDWATAEALAFGSLLDEGYNVRLSGQDSGRGTFSQRHAVYNDQQTGDRYVPLDHFDPETTFEVIDSMLSEVAVLGFEYGYSLAEPNTLTLWEAQFGDFANGAQVIVDQFLSAGEEKWLRMSGLVMLLPHGLEGQGPEHSSARLERYLQMSADDNWQVIYPTTPANYFHALRRQLHRNFRKPLIVMTPKSLLRHKDCVSHLKDMASGTSFHRILWDHAQAEPDDYKPIKPDAEIKRVVLCSGKVYYDLLAERESKDIDDIYLMRLEQLYPFPKRQLGRELSRFPNADIVWCQEEPRNMGAWTFVAPLIEESLELAKRAGERPTYVGRPASASPAEGQNKRHQQNQHKIVRQALTL
jgi:2-oxoglutarate dehydrogenase E1 component